MLKIKDNVNLKELEKFGELYWTNTDWFCYKSKDDYEIFIINKITKQLRVIEDEGQDILYDLIKAGLVKKVED